jgi:ribonuclease HI
MKKKKVKRKRPPRDPLRETFEAMLRRLGIGEWDLVLVGDGSGSNWQHECGWACLAFEASTFERRVFYGAMNKGTVNTAEMMAYLQPLCWYISKDQDNKTTGARVIHIITDSQYVEKRGPSGNAGAKKNHIMWSVLDLIKRQGYVMHWHHVPRDSVAANQFSDLLSRAARLQIKNGKILADTERKLPVQNCNPWE